MSSFSDDEDLPPPPRKRSHNSASDDESSSFAPNSDPSSAHFPSLCGGDEATESVEPRRSQRVVPQKSVHVEDRGSAASALARLRIHAVLPQRGGGIEALASERAAAAVSTGHIARCAVCWEQQEHDDAFADVAESTRRSALAESTRRFRSIIFAFERRLRGRAHDDIVFEGMLTLRRAFVERPLREHNERYRVWTLDMLRRHFAPIGGHIYDPVRILRSELDEMGQMASMVMKHALFVSPPAGDDPDSENPDKSLFNLRAVETRMKLTKQRTDLVNKLSTELARPDDIESRTILDSVAALAQRLGSANTCVGASLADDIERRYEVGGWHSTGDADLS